MTDVTIDISDVRDAINVPEATELTDAVIQSGITRAWPLVKNRLRGGEDELLIWGAYVQTAAYLAALTYATRTHQVQPGMYDPSSGKWTPREGSEGRDWGAVLNHLKELKDEYLDELTPETTEKEPTKIRRMKVIHWGRG